MLTVISAAIGLLGSFLPGLLNFLTANANNKYQLELIRLQTEAAEKNVELQIDLAQTKGDIEQQQSLYSYDAGDAGPFVNALRGSVRPVITYVLFIIWLTVTLIGLFYGIHEGQNIIQLIPVIWDDSMKAIFTTVIAFWFGSRMLEKYSVKMPVNQPQTKTTTASGRVMRMSNARITEDKPMSATYTTDTKQERKEECDGEKETRT